MWMIWGRGIRNAARPPFPITLLAPLTGFASPEAVPARFFSPPSGFT